MLIAAADACLYEAKLAGRNCVVIARADPRLQLPEDRESGVLTTIRSLE